MNNVRNGREAKKRRQESAKMREENKRTPLKQLEHLNKNKYAAVKERKKLNGKKG